MAPFISETFNLTAAQKGFMISVPILAGAFMRFPLGILAQYIGRKNAALVEMGMVMGALAFGFFFISSYNDVIAMGVLLGIAGASFGVALSLGSGSFPPKYKGLAMGIAGAGNSGTVLAVLFAPPLAVAYGWQTVYGLAGMYMLVPFAVMVIFAKEPQDSAHQTFRQHIACLFEKDGWAFSLIYAITFGGFIGLASFLPTYFHDQFGVSKVEAGQLTMLATAVAGSMIGEIGAVGGSFIPLAMGFSKEYTGTYLWGFVSFAVCALLLLAMLRKMQVRWTRTWAEKGGRARIETPHAQTAQPASPASAA